MKSQEIRGNPVDFMETRRISKTPMEFRAESQEMRGENCRNSMKSLKRHRNLMKSLKIREIHRNPRNLRKF